MAAKPVEVMNKGPALNNLFALRTRACVKYPRKIRNSGDPRPHVFFATPDFSDSFGSKELRQKETEVHMLLTVLRKPLFALLTCCVPLALIISVLAQDKDWRPVSPDDLTSKTPVVEPDADAEAIFWEVRVDDSSADDLSLKHYVRVKIFTDRGVEQYSKHDIIFNTGTKIKDVEARITNPDGSTSFLKKEDVIERDIVKANGVKVRAKTFALPNLKVGSIVEFRYREVIDNAEANMRLVFQHELPIRNISYYVKPFAGDRGMYYEPFHMGDAKFEKDKNGFSRVTMTNVPAFREEPSMLPEDDVRSWIYIYYASTERKAPTEYWKDINKFHFGHTKDTFKANDDIKNITAGLIAGAISDEEKLHRIFDWTKTNIRNLQYAPKVVEEDWKKANSSKSPGDTVKLKFGYGLQITYVFGAMARAAGFDVREAFSGNRSEMIFDPRVANASLMLGSFFAAVKMGDKWEFFNPASYYAPYGMLGWSTEGQTAMITDDKGPIWVPLGLANADKSMEKRSGKFKLLSDGSLEGEGRIEYTGHQAATIKSINRGDSEIEREKYLKDKLRSMILGSAEIESFTMENLDDPEKPVVYTFKVRIPDYASRTGKRIFFQPNVFERSAKPRFVSSTRKYDIYISYPYSESDDITVEIPEGFALESADAPTPVKDKQGIGSDQVTMGITTDGKTLVYKRTFSFGNDGYVQFPVSSYPALKQFFEAFNKVDVHQLTLKQGTVADTKSNQ